jgi:hypothetical protein
MPRHDRATALAFLCAGLAAKCQHWRGNRSNQIDLMKLTAASTRVAINRSGASVVRARICYDSGKEVYGTTHAGCGSRVPPSLPFVSNFDLIAVLAPAGMKDAFLVETTIGVSAEVVPQPLKKVSWAA